MIKIYFCHTGIESITNDLFNNPDIMQALTTTYIKTFNEAELLTNSFHRDMTMNYFKKWIAHNSIKFNP